jgi:hypothetical protein
MIALNISETRKSQNSGQDENSSGAVLESD